jgi:hypothetical protein
MENAGESKAALTSHSSLNSLTTWAPQIRFAKILSILQHLARIAKVLTLCYSRHKQSAISLLILLMADS